MKVYWISYEIKNVPRDAHSRVWKNVAYATALGARVRKRTLCSFYKRFWHSPYKWMVPKKYYQQRIVLNENK